MTFKLPTLFAMVAMTASSALADTKLPLFNATSDAFVDRLEFALSVDANSNVTGLVYTADVGERQISFQELSDGAVLYQASGKDVVTMTSKNFSPTTGGDVTLTHLVNGVTGSYKNFNFNVSRQGQSWLPSVMNSRGIPQSFVSMYLKAKRLLGKIVGIDTITVQ